MILAESIMFHAIYWVSQNNYSILHYIIHVAYKQQKGSRIYKTVIL